MSASVPIIEGPVDLDSRRGRTGAVGIGDLVQDVVHVHRGRELAAYVGEGDDQLSRRRGRIEAGDDPAVLDQVAADERDAIAVSFLSESSVLN